MSGFYEQFSLSNEFNILRIICGAFFVPHIFGKYVERKFTVGFFTKAGFNPPELYIWIALIVEAILSIALILGIYPTIAGSIAAVHLAIAGAAVYRVSDGRWFWNLGGYEYCAFWLICCVVVAMHG